MILPSDASIARERVKLWFFRDMTDAQRIELLKLFGLPADEMGTHGAQTHGLRHVFDALSAAEFDAKIPSVVHTIPEKVTTFIRRVCIEPEIERGHCPKYTGNVWVGIHCAGLECLMRPCSHPGCATPTTPGPCAFDACPRK